MSPAQQYPSVSYGEGDEHRHALAAEPYIIMLDPLANSTPGRLETHASKFPNRPHVKHLTPVLGVEASDGLAVPGQVLHMDADLRHRVEGSPDLSNFLERVCEMRAAHREWVDLTLPDRRLAKDLTDLRLHLLTAAFALTRLFAESWVIDLVPVNDWRVHAVDFAFSEHGPSGQVKKELVAAREAATRFGRHQDPYSEGESRTHLRLLLGPDGIDHRLDTLIRDLPGASRLDGSLVEWVTDLFWHTLIFESPCYPRPDELAFQLSMAANPGSDHPTRKYEPTAMVERHADDQFRRAIKHSIRRAMRAGDEEPRPCGRLQEAAAASLVSQYAVRATRKKVHPFPIAISLSADLELEKALAFNQHCDAFHVAFPVVHAMNVTGKGTLRWLVGRFYGGRRGRPRDARGVWAALSAPVDGWRWLNDVVPPGLDVDSAGSRPPEEVLSGPLILKVNGSPLHNVAGDASTHQHLAPSIDNGILRGDLGRSTDDEHPLGHFFHVPAVTELDVLQLSQVDDWSRGARQQATGQDRAGAAAEPVKAGLPLAVVQELMASNRFWLIAGHDLSDWSARLQLFGQISRAVLAGGSQALAVSRKEDVDRARLLANLGIPICFGNFEELSHHITATADMALRDAGLGATR